VLRVFDNRYVSYVDDEIVKYGNRNGGVIIKKSNHKRIVKVVTHNPEWKQMYVKEAKKYSLLKEKLAEEYRDDPAKYTKEKKEFIEDIEEKAKGLNS